MAKFSVWGGAIPHDENEDHNCSGVNKEKLDDQKIMKSNVLVTAKIRKLMLRLELWNIYEKVFLNNEGGMENKNRAAASLLDDALEGQKNAQQRIATIFSSDSTIENWESVLSKLKFFEEESDTIPLVSGTEDSTIPMTELTVEVRASDDTVIKEVVLNFSTDPHQLACEIQVEHRLPPEEIDYIQGMLQHEMLGLVRQGMTDQREKLKSIQKKTAIIEHLVMLNENVSMKYAKTSKMYDTSSSHLKATSNASSTPTPPSFQSASASRTPVSSKNRTLVHFNKLIIDERRKLDQVEQEMVKIFKKMGKMTASDYYKAPGNIPIFTNGKEIPAEKKTPSSSKKKTNQSPVPSPKAGNRRASVSMRSVMMQPIQVSTMSLDEEDEDEDGDTFGAGGGFSTPLKSSISHGKATPEEEEEEMNTFGLSDHEIEKKILFRKSEKDRMLLIAENKRLRDIINSVDMSSIKNGAAQANIPMFSDEKSSQNDQNVEVLNLDDGDLRGLINELNAWDIERDELDGQIDNLNDKKDELKRKLAKQKEKKAKKLMDKEHLQLQRSMMSFH